MVCSKLYNAKILGISTTIPKNESDLRAKKNLYNGDERRIQRLINSSGFNKRRIVDSNTTTSDLCYSAACDLIKQLNINTQEIDGLIFVSYTPDYLMPATSYVLHKRLNLNENCIVMDIPQACSGYVIGLYQAAMLINSGCKKVLLLVGDTFSKFNDMFSETEPEIFGDAGSATLLEFNPSAQEMYFNVNSNGQCYDALICKNGGFRNIVKKDLFYKNGNFIYNSKMNGKEIFDFTMEKIAPSIKDLLKFSQKTVSEMDYVVLHQANKFIMQNIINQIEFDEAKSPMTTLSKFGNQCGASIPNTICDTLQEQVTNDNLQLLLCGFGVGLSWASAIINTQKIYCSKNIEFKGENNG